MAPESLSAAMSDLPNPDSSESQLHPDLLDSGSLFQQSQDADQSNDEWTATAAAVAAVQAAQGEEGRSNEPANNDQDAQPTPPLVDMNQASGSGSLPSSAPNSRPNSALGSRPTSALDSRSNTPPVLQTRLPNINESTDDAPPPPKKTRKRSSAGTKAQRALIVEEGMPAEYEDPKGDFRTGVIYVHAPASTPQACMRCHAIKRKCDNRRPRCSGCEKADEPCAYEMNPATSRFVNNLKDEQALTELKLEETSREKDERIAQLEQFILQTGHAVPPPPPRPPYVQPVQTIQTIQVYGQQMLHPQMFLQTHHLQIPQPQHPQQFLPQPQPQPQYHQPQQSQPLHQQVLHQQLAQHQQHVQQQQQQQQQQTHVLQPQPQHRRYHSGGFNM